MNKDRLLLLAEKLETVVPAAKFNLQHWRSTYGADSDAQLLNDECGTTGCAIGWACAMPEFIEQGLYWNARAFEPGLNTNGLHFGNWRAVEVFFGLNHVQSGHLFSSSYYPEEKQAQTPDQVANRIRALIAHDREVFE
ncbi:hypothetical protein [Variovorax sp. LT1R16]|uniref:hypothetical protein n=1 Tax=Variovorax sp. LT1R16 TaxID=3443728 RepID=UPI003F47D33B